MGELDERELLEEHLEKYLGKCSGVLHSAASGLAMGVHHDYYIYPPVPDRNFWIIASLGMSFRRMNVPVAGKAYCELMVFLSPNEWNLNSEDFFTGKPVVPNYPVPTKPFQADPKLNWVLSGLQKLNMFPFMFRTWIGHGHTVDMEGYETGGYQGWVVRNPILINRNISTLKVAGKLVNFYVIQPIHQNELHLAQNSGTDRLFRQFDKKGISEITTIRRKKVR